MLFPAYPEGMHVTLDQPRYNGLAAQPDDLRACTDKFPDVPVRTECDYMTVANRKRLTLPIIRVEYQNFSVEQNSVGAAA